MPELPEVETTCRGVAPHLVGQRIADVIVRERQLRYLIPSDIGAKLKNKTITKIERRAKYILIFLANKQQKHAEHESCQEQGLLIHLGMSGSLRVIAAAGIHQEVKKHDHVDIVLANKHILRYHDPRKFGLIVWADDLYQQSLLAALGPEPFAESFDGDYLYELAQKRSIPVKPFIMDQKTVVGVGNIYAAEALFMSGISPKRAANKISRARYEILSNNIKKILAAAIKQGGTTLKDFVNSAGQPGYFKQQLAVYGRANMPCVTCARALKEIKLGQRASVYCSYCQR